MSGAETAPRVCSACDGRGFVLPATVANEAQAVAMAPECKACEGTGTAAVVDSLDAWIESRIWTIREAALRAGDDAKVRLCDLALFAEGDAVARLADEIAGLA